MPEQYGDYEVESFLGKGSIGKVFLARHRRIGRRVALKTVMLDQKFEDEQDQTEFHKRLQREAELCASMQHPNIVTLYDVGYEGDVVAWLATEYVDGESLLARLRRSHPLPLEEALSISADILRGLAYAHSKGIIHRDIKPANILLTSAGQAKIADFGVARPLHSSLTVTRSLVGTPNYMSPEQVKTSPVSTRSDLFSAGTLMYELLTGKRPFLGAELSAILYNVVNLTPPLASSAHQQVPEPVAKIVARLMEKRPEDRYPTAEEALADLTLIREGGTPQFADYTVGNDTIVANTDSTTPLPTVVDDNASTPALHRRIPAMLFWGVILGLIAALASSMTLALDHAEELKAPTGIITAEQQRTASEKALALESLRGLMDEGKFEEAVTGYDNFLARHPESVAARIERDEAQRLLEEAAPKSEITRTATSSSATKKKEPETPPSRWQRVKRWFRGN